MTTKTQQRTLIHEDKDKLNAMLKDVDQMMPILKKIQSTYSDLEIGKLNNDIFQEILSKGTARIKREYLAKEEDQIKKAGITSTRLQKNMMNGADEVFEKFNSQVKMLKEFNAPRYGMTNTPLLPKSYITSFKNGGFAVLKEQREEILEEYCRTYLEGPEEHEAYQKAQDFISAFKSFKDHLDKLDFRWNGSLSSIENQFLTYKNGQPTLKPSIIRFMVSGQNEWERKKEQNRKETQRFHREMSAPTMNEIAGNKK